MRRGKRTVLVAATLLVTAVVAHHGAASAGVHRRTGPGFSRIPAHGLRAVAQGEEQAFVDKINALRSSRGLPPVAVDLELTEQARVWADTMLQQGRIFHSTTLTQGITSDWQKLGENVGVGPTVDDLFAAFVESPKHYDNLVDPKYAFIGVGVAWAGTQMYTAHRFMGLFPAGQPSAPAPPTQPPTAKPVTKPTVPPTAPQTAPPTTSTPVTVPDELAATDPSPTPPTTALPAVPPVSPRAPSADPRRVALVLSSLSRAFT